MASTEPAVFQVGHRYRMTFIGDSNLHVIYQVTRRTAQFVTLTDGHDVIRCKVRPAWDDKSEEVCNPLGSYSMAPSLSAKRRVTEPVGPVRTGIGV